MKPRIGITTWLRPLPTYLGEQTLLYTLGYEYVDHVAAAGGLPLLLPQGDDPGEVLDLLDGLLLTGGGDVHPASYGDIHNGTSKAVNERADGWEIELVRTAAARGMPVLGICRGMQIMAVAFGGHMMQDLAAVEGHPDMARFTGSEILGLRHTVTFDLHCTLAAIYDSVERQVNTIHHQAVIDAGQLRVIGWGVGGVIEAIEAHDQEAWPAIGVQWHPEKMDEALELRLFTYFVTAAARYGHAREKQHASREGGLV
jgi:putative glutamine amidotransferase